MLSMSAWERGEGRAQRDGARGGSHGEMGRAARSAREGAIANRLDGRRAWGGAPDGSPEGRGVARPRHVPTADEGGVGEARDLHGPLARVQLERELRAATDICGPATRRSGHREAGRVCGAVGPPFVGREATHGSRVGGVLWAPAVRAQGHAGRGDVRGARGASARTALRIGRVELGVVEEQIALAPREVTIAHGVPAAHARALRARRGHRPPKGGAHARK